MSLATQQDKEIKLIEKNFLTDVLGRKSLFNPVFEKETGKGAYSFLYKGKLSIDGKETTEDYAFKYGKHNLNYKSRELSILLKIAEDPHPNIIKLLYYSEAVADSFCYVFDFIPETLHQLEKYCLDHKISIDEKEIKIMMLQFFNGLDYLEKKGICHRDIKPQNILLKHEDLSIIITDFGSAKILDDGTKNTAYICSRYWRAPELFYGNQNYTIKIDHWSAGIIFLEMYNLDFIFKGKSCLGMLTLISYVLGPPSASELRVLEGTSKEVDPSESLGQECYSILFDDTKTLMSPEAMEIVKSLLKYDPKKRASPKEILRMAYFLEQK